MSITVITGKKYVKMINLETGHTLYAVTCNQKPLFYKGVGVSINNSIISAEWADETDTIIETLIPCDNYPDQLAQLREDVERGLISEDNKETYFSQVRQILYYDRLVNQGIEVKLDIVNGFITGVVHS